MGEGPAGEPSTCVVLNPVAGGVARHPGVVRRLGVLAGRRLHRTRRPGHAAELAREALTRGCRRIVVAGGDGTLQEVVNGLGDEAGRVELGLVPLGTGNDFVRSVGIPTDPIRALASMEAYRARPVDVLFCRRGSATGDGEPLRVVNFAIGGFGGRVARHVTERRRRFWGSLVYLRAALADLPGLASYPARIRVDGEPVAEEPVLAVIVANGRWLGHGIPAAPEARIDDGLLDVVWIRAISSLRLPLLILRVLRARHLGHPAVSIRRGTRVDVRSAASMPYNADGQELGRGDVEFRVEPGALRVLAPDRGPALRGGPGDE